MERGIIHRRDLHDEPVAEPAPAGTPPRRPPTAVGLHDNDDHDPIGPAPRWHDAFSLDLPLAETTLPPRIVSMLWLHGHHSVRDVLDLTDHHLGRDGLGLVDRSRFRLWRHSWRMASRRR